MALSGRDLALIAVMGLGPLGAAFFLWDRALASTALLVLVTGRAFSASIVAAAALIIGAAVVGTRAR